MGRGCAIAAAIGPAFSVRNVFDSSAADSEITKFRGAEACEFEGVGGWESCGGRSWSLIGARWRSHTLDRDTRQSSKLRRTACTRCAACERARSGLHSFRATAKTALHQRWPDAWSCETAARRVQAAACCG